METRHALSVLFSLFSTEFTSRLTNEESRKNWEEHGNPDGPGGRAAPSLYFDSIKIIAYSVKVAALN